MPNCIVHVILFLFSVYNPRNAASQSHMWSDGGRKFAAFSALVVVNYVDSQCLTINWRFPRCGESVSEKKSAQIEVAEVIRSPDSLRVRLSVHAHQLSIPGGLQDLSKNRACFCFVLTLSCLQTKDRMWKNQAHQQLRAHGKGLSLPECVVISVQEFLGPSSIVFVPHRSLHWDCLPGACITDWS